MICKLQEAANAGGHFAQSLKMALFFKDRASILEFDTKFVPFQRLHPLFIFNIGQQHGSDRSLVDMFVHGC
jgi:hypothetical protein